MGGERLNPPCSAGVRGTVQVGRGPRALQRHQGLEARGLRGSVAAPLPGEDQRPPKEGRCVLYSESDVDPESCRALSKGTERTSAGEC